MRARSREEGVRRGGADGALRRKHRHRSARDRLGHRFCLCGAAVLPRIRQRAAAVAVVAGFRGGARNQCQELQMVRAAVGGGPSRLGADVYPRSAAFGGKLPVIAGTPEASWPGRTRRGLAESPANRADSSPARARIAPRRPPVRVRLAPSREPRRGAGFHASGGVAPSARQRFFGPVFGPISALRIVSRVMRSTI